MHLGVSFRSQGGKKFLNSVKRLLFVMKAVLFLENRNRIFSVVLMFFRQNVTGTLGRSH